MTWLAGLQQSGYAIFPEVFEPGELDEVLTTLETIPRSKAGIRHLLSQKPIAAIAADRRLLQIARKVLDEDALPFRATLFDKSPDSNWLVVWHQDTALPLQTRKEIPGWGPWSLKAGIHYAHAPATALEKVLALRLHLDDSTLRNGPLRVLPGTHRQGVLSDDEISKFVAKIPAVDCVAPSGCIVAMRPLIIHSSSKLDSHLPRRVLHIEYASSPFITDDLELALA